MSDPRSKVGDQDLKGGIDGDKLAKEARELELRQKIEKLQRLKSRGLSYDDAGATSSKLAPASSSGSKLERVSETLLEEQMREAEAMFGGPVVTNPQEAAAERAKAAANAAAAEKAELESGDSFFDAVLPGFEKSLSQKRQAQNEVDPIVQAMKSAKASKDEITRESKVGVRQNESSLANEMEEAISKALNQSTSGIGGKWTAPDTMEKHKPSKSGSWGVFERPADISKAYGGGKRIGVGAAPQVDEEKVAAEAAKTAAALARFRKDQGASPSQERERKAEIEAALEKARLSMVRGICSEAVEALEEIVPFISYGTVVGGTAFIELGMALEASGRPDKALDIYRKLIKQSGDEAIRKQAKQLEYGFEAMEFFGMGDAASEAAKLAKPRSLASGRSLSNPIITNRAWSGEYFDKSYDSTYYFVTSESRNKIRKQLDDIGSFREARDILLRSVALRCAASSSSSSRAAVADDAIGSARVMQALRFMAQCRGPGQTPGGGGHFERELQAKGQQRGQKKEVNDNKVIVGGGATKSKDEQSEIEDESGRVDDGPSRDDPTLLKGFWRLVLTTTVDGDVRFMSGGAAASDTASTEMALVRELLPTTGAVPAYRVELPLGLARVDCAGRFSRPWPNSDWEVAIELDGGTCAGPFPIPIPIVPQPAPARLLTVDEQLHVTMAIQKPGNFGVVIAGEAAAPIFEVWLRN